MPYELSKDEEVFLCQVKQRLDGNLPIAEVPQLWRPAHFDENRFSIAYIQFCLAICPDLNIPNARYYQSFKFSKSQSDSIQAWIDWYKGHAKPTQTTVGNDEISDASDYYKRLQLKLSEKLPERTKHSGRPSDFRPEGSSVCHVCHGAGRMSGRTCSTCRGFGYLGKVRPDIAPPQFRVVPPPPKEVSISRPPADFRVAPSPDECLLCHGSGIHKAKTCKRCSGTGLDPWRASA